MKKDFENLCSAAIKESHDQSIHRQLTRFFKGSTIAAHAK
jgi:hypothetical protein